MRYKAIGVSSVAEKPAAHLGGGTICYAYMQGVGMVNDHLAACFRHKQLA